MSSSNYSFITNTGTDDALLATAASGAQASSPPILLSSGASAQRTAANAQRTTQLTSELHSRTANPKPMPLLCTVSEVRTKARQALELGQTIVSQQFSVSGLLENQSSQGAAIIQASANGTVMDIGTVNNLNVGTASIHLGPGGVVVDGHHVADEFTANHNSIVQIEATAAAEALATAAEFAALALSKLAVPPGFVPLPPAAGVPPDPAGQVNMEPLCLAPAGTYDIITNGVTSSATRQLGKVGVNNHFPTREMDISGQCRISDTIEVGGAANLATAVATYSSPGIVSNPNVTAVYLGGNALVTTSGLIDAAALNCEGTMTSKGETILGLNTGVYSTASPPVLMNPGDAAVILGPNSIMQVDGTLRSTALLTSGTSTLSGECFLGLQTAVYNTAMPRVLQNPTDSSVLLGPNAIVQVDGTIRATAAKIFGALIAGTLNGRKLPALYAASKDWSPSLASLRIGLLALTRLVRKPIVSKDWSAPVASLRSGLLVLTRLVRKPALSKDWSTPIVRNRAATLRDKHRFILPDVLAKIARAVILANHADKKQKVTNFSIDFSTPIARVAKIALHADQVRHVTNVSRDYSSSVARAIRVANHADKQRHLTGVSKDYSSAIGRALTQNSSSNTGLRRLIRGTVVTQPTSRGAIRNAIFGNGFQCYPAAHLYNTLQVDGALTAYGTSSLSGNTLMTQPSFTGSSLWTAATATNYVVNIGSYGGEFVGLVSVTISGNGHSQMCQMEIQSHASPSGTALVRASVPYASSSAFFSAVSITSNRGVYVYIRDPASTGTSVSIASTVIHTGGSTLLNSVFNQVTPFVVTPTTVPDGGFMIPIQANGGSTDSLSLNAAGGLTAPNATIASLTAGSISASGTASLQGPVSAAAGVSVAGSTAVSFQQSYGVVSSAAGTKLMLFPNVAGSTGLGDNQSYALGIGNSYNLWYNVASVGQHQFNVGAVPRVSVTSNALRVNEQGTSGTGVQLWNDSNWGEYVSPSGGALLSGASGTACSASSINSSVTSYAVRSRAGNSNGQFGWIWEQAVGEIPMMALDSRDGILSVRGGIRVGTSSSIPSSYVPSTSLPKTTILTGSFSVGGGINSYSGIGYGNGFSYTYSTPPNVIVSIDDTVAHSAVTNGIGVSSFSVTVSTGSTVNASVRWIAIGQGP